MALSAGQITAITAAQGKVNAQMDALHIAIMRANALLLIGSSVDQPSAHTEITNLKSMISAVIAELQTIVA